MTHTKLRKLKISYGENNALKEINVDIPDKQITAIIGPSGCGKTTLLKSINRIIELSEGVKVRGEVLIDGANIYGKDADVLALRKKVGFLPQRPCPLPMSIYDNVAFGPRIHRLSEEQITKQLEKQKTNGLVKKEKSRKYQDYSKMDHLVEHYLKLAGLWDEVKDRLHSPASKLSIGQQQRLALARVLAIEPEVILADEPTSALDPLSAKLVEEQFKLLKKDYTIVIVTHILRQARRIADYVMFMYLGELVEHGPAERFFNAPQKEKTKEYLSGEIS